MIPTLNIPFDTFQGVTIGLATHAVLRGLVCFFSEKELRNERD